MTISQAIGKLCIMAGILLAIRVASDWDDLLSLAVLFVATLLVLVPLIVWSKRRARRHRIDWSEPLPEAKQNRSS